MLFRGEPGGELQCFVVAAVHAEIAVLLAVPGDLHGAVVPRDAHHIGGHAHEDIVHAVGALTGLGAMIGHHVVGVALRVGHVLVVKGLAGGSADLHGRALVVTLSSVDAVLPAVEAGVPADTDGVLLVEDLGQMTLLQIHALAKGAVIDPGDGLLPLGGVFLRKRRGLQVVVFNEIVGQRVGKLAHAIHVQVDVDAIVVVLKVVVLRSVHVHKGYAEGLHIFPGHGSIAVVMAPAGIVGALGHHQRYAVLVTQLLDHGEILLG